MEPVSLSVSVVALISLFDTALDCFKRVKVAKSFGTDYQTYVLRLQNLRLRFSRWGEAVGLGKQSTAVDQPTTSVLSESEVKQAAAVVGHIIRLFSDTEGLAAKYTGKESDLVVMDEHADGLSDVGKLCQKMRDICLRRQREASVAMKAKWSLFSKDKFIELIGSIQSLVEDLVNLFPTETRVSMEQNLCDQEARQLRGEKALPTLQTLALTQDVRLAEAIAKLEQGGAGKTTTFNNYDNTKIMSQNEIQNIYGGQHVSF